MIVFHQDAELTVQEAADFLNVSVPYVVELLDESKLAFHNIDSSRLVCFKNLMEYKEQFVCKQNDVFDELVKQSQELKMGY